MTPTPPLLLTIPAAARRLGISRSMMSQSWPALAAHRGLQTVAVGRSRRVVTKSLEACVAQLVRDGWPEKGTSR